MKQIKNLFALAILVVISACTTDYFGVNNTEELIDNSESEVKEYQISPDSTLVGFNPIIEFESQVMTKGSNNSMNDLYGIRVFIIGESSQMLSAYGTFDDLSQAVVKMSKTEKYAIDVTYIPNGKNLVYKYNNNHYGVPFDAVWNSNNGNLNEVVYVKPDDTEPVWSLSYGAVRGKDVTDSGKSNDWSTIRRYQGVALCDPSTESTINVTLYPQMIGFHITITDFTEGTVTIGGTFGNKYTYTPDVNNSVVIDLEVCMENMPSVEYEWSGIFRDESIDPIEYILNKPKNQSVTISYNDGNDDIILYRNVNFNVTRNTRYVTSFSLSDAITNGGITANVADDEMNETNFMY